MIIKRYSALIIGANYGLNTLYPILNNNRNINLIGICSLNKKNLKSSSINFLYNWKKIIKIYKPDFVVLAVPPLIQSKIIKYLILKNIPFFGQKPLSYNLSDAQLIARKIKKKKLPSSFDLNFLKLKAIIKFKKIIQKKKLYNSKIIIKWIFESRTLGKRDSWKNSSKAGGGILYNFGFHLFSILVDIFGILKITKIHANKNSYKLCFADNNKNNYEVHLSNKKDNKNFFDITVTDDKDDVISLRNVSKNYHDNFTLRKNKKILFVQKNSKKFNISRQIASAANLKNFFNDLKKDKQNYISQNIDICVQVHKIINEIVHK
ncbi:Gfo/Idh/MocA family oxidoreductase [Candidatus Pelagibacter sp.]|nr:Gfo/Idh/MocA family oxidoreductase [Candidatus Pelagibacter sp.]